MIAELQAELEEVEAKLKALELGQLEQEELEKIEHLDRSWQRKSRQLNIR